MIDAVRARASLLIVGLVVFLLILWSVPRWNPDWVQAIGSIGAIAAGFGYAAMQQSVQRKERERQERYVREHVTSLGERAREEMQQRSNWILQAIETGQSRPRIPSHDSLDIVADELLLVRPTECGGADFSVTTRLLAVWIKAFAFSCRQAFDNQPFIEVEARRADHAFEMADHYLTQLKAIEASRR